MWRARITWIISSYCSQESYEEDILSPFYNQEKQHFSFHIHLKKSHTKLVKWSLKSKSMFISETSLKNLLNGSAAPVINICVYSYSLSLHSILSCVCGLGVWTWLSWGFCKVAIKVLARTGFSSETWPGRIHFQIRLFGELTSCSSRIHSSQLLQRYQWRWR